MRKQDRGCIFDNDPATVVTGDGIMQKEDMACVFDNSSAIMAMGGGV